MLKKLSRVFPFLTKLKIAYHLMNARRYAENRYFRQFGRAIDWDAPTEFNEKIRVLQFKTDTSLWVRLADKYAVREYIQEKGLGDILVKLYAKWEKPRDVNISALPKSFVVKSNNGCGDVLVISDKNDIEEKMLREYVRNALVSKFGLHSAEMHYSYISPCVIVEEKLTSDAKFSNCLVDYKFYVFDGEPLICGVYYDRRPNSHITKSIFYDMEWNAHNEWHSSQVTTHSKEIPRPIQFERMKEICRTLCKGIPFVRLDLYEVGGKVYFGEYTFTPAACSGGSLNPHLFNYLGSLINIPK